MPGLPSYEDTQRGLDQCPLYENVVLEGPPSPLPHCAPPPPDSDLWHHQPPYPLNALVSHTTPPVRLQVSLPPEWPAECATLTNYRYNTLDGFAGGLQHSEPSLLLDRNGRPLQPGGGNSNGSVPLLQQQRVGQYVEAQNAVLASELYQSALELLHQEQQHASAVSRNAASHAANATSASAAAGSGNDPGAGRDHDNSLDGGTTTYEEFLMGVVDGDSSYRRRERTCAKGFFVVCLIISAIAIIVFLVIAVLKSVHII